MPAIALSTVHLCGPSPHDVARRSTSLFLLAVRSCYVAQAFMLLHTCGGQRYSSLACHLVPATLACHQALNSGPQAYIPLNVEPLD